MFQPYRTIDGELICEFCKYPRDKAVGNVQEVDSPWHCSECGRPLEHTLTITGVNYVLKSLQEEMAKGSVNFLRKNVGEETKPYYRGTTGPSVAKDWAEDLLNYNLTKEQKSIVDRFLRMTS